MEFSFADQRGGGRGMVPYEWLASAHMCAQLHLQKQRAYVPAARANGACVHTITYCLGRWGCYFRNPVPNGSKSNSGNILVQIIKKERIHIWSKCLYYTLPIIMFTTMWNHNITSTLFSVDLYMHIFFPFITMNVKFSE